jgi:hypothetical protein
MQRREDISKLTVISLWYSTTKHPILRRTFEVEKCSCTEVIMNSGIPRAFFTLSDEQFSLKLILKRGGATSLLSSRKSLSWPPTIKFAFCEGLEKKSTEISVAFAFAFSFSPLSLQVFAN